MLKTVKYIQTYNYEKALFFLCSGSLVIYITTISNLPLPKLFYDTILENILTNQIFLTSTASVSLALFSAYIVYFLSVVIPRSRGLHIAIKELYFASIVLESVVRKIGTVEMGATNREEIAAKAESLVSGIEKHGIAISKLEPTGNENIYQTLDLFYKNALSGKYEFIDKLQATQEVISSLYQYNQFYPPHTTKLINTTNILLKLLIEVKVKLHQFDYDEVKNDTNKESHSVVQMQLARLCMYTNRLRETNEDIYNTTLTSYIPDSQHLSY